MKALSGSPNSTLPVGSKTCKQKRPVGVHANNQQNIHLDENYLQDLKIYKFFNLCVNHELNHTVRNYVLANLALWTMKNCNKVAPILQGCNSALHGWIFFWKFTDSEISKAWIGVDKLIKCNDGLICTNQSEQSNIIFFSMSTQLWLKIRQQAITWTSVDPVTIWHHLATMS